MTRINDQRMRISTYGFLLLAGGMVAVAQSNPGRCRIWIKLRPQPEPFYKTTFGMEIKPRNISEIEGDAVV